MPNSRINEAISGRPFAGRSVVAHGKAALLLVECLVHHLVDKAVLTREEFVEIIRGAAEVKYRNGITPAYQSLTFQWLLVNPLGAAFRKELSS